MSERETLRSPVTSCNKEPTAIKSILVLFAHPAFQKSRVNRQLVAAIRDLEGVTFHDLYEAYPSFHIDVKREQELLRAHDIVVFHHPMYWYSTPAILKEWQDLVLEYGFAYGEDGTALEGKALMTAITTGGGPDAYRRGGHNHYSIPEFLAPFERTAILCLMRYLPPFVVHDTRALTSQETVAPHAAAYREVIVHLRDEKVDEKNLAKHTYINEILEGSDA